MCRWAKPELNTLWRAPSSLYYARFASTHLELAFRAERIPQNGSTQNRNSIISTFEDGLVTLSRDSYELLVFLIGASLLMFALS